MDDPRRGGGSDAQRRCSARLLRDRTALRTLRELGVDDEAVDRHMLGLASEVVDTRTGLLLRRALRFPIMGPDGFGRAMYGTVCIPGITTSQQMRGPTSRPMPPETCWSRPLSDGARVTVVGDPLAMWRAAATAAPDLVVICPSHDAGIPVEWRAERFWQRFSEMTLADDLRSDLRVALEPYVVLAGQRSPDLDRDAAKTPTKKTRPGGANERYARDGAPVASPPASAPAVARGRAEDCVETATSMHLPASLAGVVIGGLCHYPHRIEISRPGFAGDDAARIHRYETVVLRSDGETLRLTTLPFPPGTKPHHRVHVLSDGTRVSCRAAGAAISTWSERGMRRFVSDVRARRPVSRPVAAMIADVELSLRSSVWLPCDDAYALVAAFIMATHVYRAFPALPILLACGPSASGKSELARSVAALGFNAVLLGQTTAAGVARTSELSGGLVILDDCEALGGAGVGSPDLQQALRVGYKAATAGKAVVERTGEVRVDDLFGPRMVVNTSGASPALLSRSALVTTAPAPRGHLDQRVTAEAPDLASLRDELHAWGMGAIAGIAADCERAVSERAPRDRDEEVALPLTTIARLAAGDVDGRVLAALRDARASAVQESAETTFDRALAELSSTGVGSEVSMLQIAMEVALANRGQRPTGALASAEWIGARLTDAGLRDASAPVTRRRLFGQITRVYTVSGAWRRRVGSDAGAARDAVSFCTDRPCGECRYARVCSLVAPGLQPGRARSGVPA